MIGYDTTGHQVPLGIFSTTKRIFFTTRSSVYRQAYHVRKYNDRLYINIKIKLLLTFSDIGIMVHFQLETMNEFLPRIIHYVRKYKDRTLFKSHIRMPFIFSDNLF